MNECDRLANDVILVDEVIGIFQQELSGIDEIIRNQVDDYFEDDRFDQGIFGRTQQNFAQYEEKGGLKATIQAEAAMML